MLCIFFSIFHQAYAGSSIYQPPGIQVVGNIQSANVNPTPKPKATKRPRATESPIRKEARLFANGIECSNGVKLDWRQRNKIQTVAEDMLENGGTLSSFASSTYMSSFCAVRNRGTSTFDGYFTTVAIYFYPVKDHQKKAIENGLITNAQLKPLIRDARDEFVRYQNGHPKTKIQIAPELVVNTPVPLKMYDRISFQIPNASTYRYASGSYRGPNLGSGRPFEFNQLYCLNTSNGNIVGSNTYCDPYDSASQAFSGKRITMLAGDTGLFLFKAKNYKVEAKEVQLPTPSPTPFPIVPSGDPTPTPTPFPAAQYEWVMIGVTQLADVPLAIDDIAKAKPVFSSNLDQITELISEDEADLRVVTEDEYRKKNLSTASKSCNQDKKCIEETIKESFYKSLAGKGDDEFQLLGYQKYLNERSLFSD